MGKASIRIAIVFLFVSGLISCSQDKDTDNSKHPLDAIGAQPDSDSDPSSVEEPESTSDTPATRSPDRKPTSRSDDWQLDYTLAGKTRQQMLGANNIAQQSLPASARLVFQSHPADSVRALTISTSCQYGLDGPAHEFTLERNHLVELSLTQLIPRSALTPPQASNLQLNCTIRGEVVNRYGSKKRFSIYQLPIDSTDNIANGRFIEQKNFVAGGRHFIVNQKSMQTFVRHQPPAHSIGLFCQDFQRELFTQDRTLTFTDFLPTSDLLTTPMQTCRFISANSRGETVTIGATFQLHSSPLQPLQIWRSHGVVVPYGDWIDASEDHLIHWTFHNPNSSTIKVRFAQSAPSRLEVVPIFFDRYQRLLGRGSTFRYRLKVSAFLTNSHGEKKSTDLDKPITIDPEDKLHLIVTGPFRLNCSRHGSLIPDCEQPILQGYIYRYQNLPQISQQIIHTPTGSHWQNVFVAQSFTYLFPRNSIASSNNWYWHALNSHHKCQKHKDIEFELLLPKATPKKPIAHNCTTD